MKKTEIRDRPRFFAGVVLLTLAFSSLPAVAQKTIRLVVPFGAGGAPDVIARLMAPAISEQVGSPVVVDNRPGATGIIAAEHVKSSPPDGSTLFVADSAHFAINPALRANLPYDPQKDFVPVIEVASSMIYIAVPAQSPAKSVQELVALAKSRAQGLTYGSSATERRITCRWNCSSCSRAPFRARAVQGSRAVGAGGAFRRVDVVVAGPASLLPHVRAGKLRMIAAVNPMRWSRMAEISTVAESGFGQYALDIPSGSSPRPAPGRDGAAAERGGRQGLRSPEVAGKAADIGLEMIAGTPQAFAQSIQRQRENYGRVVTSSGAKAD